MQVGWLGLGAMGAPMAARAARAGHVVRGYDIVPGRAASLAADGVRPAGTAAAAAGGADLIVIMVATPEQVEAPLFAPGGAAGSLAAGSALDIFVKDMGLVGAAAEQAGAAAPLAAAARRLCVRGHDLGLGRLDDSALIEVLRREHGAPAREDDPACPAHSGNSSPGHGATRSRAE